MSGVDHILLRQTTIWEQIGKLCRKGMEYGTASVCIPPCYVKQAKDFVGDKLTVCTVTGFPNSNMATTMKVSETEDTVKDGAGEIDMVISIDLVEAGHHDQILNEIRQIKTAYSGRRLKVIIKTCLLAEEERREMCRVATESGADLTGTSTGFSIADATSENVALTRKYSGPEVKVRTAGGIVSIEDAERFIELNANRLGISRPIPQAENLNRALQPVLHYRLLLLNVLRPLLQQQPLIT